MVVNALRRPWCRLFVLLAALLTAGLATSPATAQPTRELRVAMMAVSGQQRTMLIETMEAFEKRHPDLYVRFDQLEHESYKDRFEQLARGGQYDVLFWFAGERLAAAVRAGLVRPLETVPGSDAWRADFPASLVAATTVDGRAYAMPLSYYNWGFYYMIPQFERVGLAPPRSWDELMRAAEILNSHGVTPFALGSRFPWTLAGWYDYLNMRLHGIDHHLAQLRGEVTFDSPETRAVLELWADLFRRGWFQADHAENDWRAVLPGLMRGQTGMVLMGNFIVSQLPTAQRSNLGYFQFPVMDPLVPRGEDAPTDVMLVPAAARNVEAAGLFLAYMAEPEVQTRFNTAIGQLPPRNGAPLPDDPLLQAGAETVGTAAGAAQFFDRDALPAIRDAGLAAFAAFAGSAKDATAIEAAVATLEKGRAAARAEQP